MDSFCQSLKMDSKSKHINGYILAGGKSSRMGKDKGLLILNSKAIVQTIIEQLQPAVNKTIIVNNIFRSINNSINL